MTTTDLQRQAYDQLADVYAQSYAEPRSEGFHWGLDLCIPRLLDIVGSVAGLTVLDAGCGEGIVSRSLAGAAQMVGIDLSARLIAHARARDTTNAITYLVGDLSQPLPHYQHTFDVVVSNLVLNDVPDYVGFLATLSDVLKPGGRLVMTINNPYSALLREKVDNYFATGTAVPYGFGPVFFYHRTMEDYLAACAGADLLLRRLYDVRVSEEMVAHLPEKNKHFAWYPFYHRFPFMLILDLIKGTA